jgi:transcription antitermination factor NusG
MRPQTQTKLPSRLREAKPASIGLESWYAIYTKSRFEKKIFHSLRSKGFHVFLPLVKEKRMWSDRIKTVEVPLLPSYVFVRTAREKFAQIYPYPGFVRFVSFQGKPCEIREEEIALLEQIVEHGFHVQQSPLCDLGDRVRITRGPLRGWEGCVEKKKGASRVVFRFDCIQQAISVEVEVGDVELV